MLDLASDASACFGDNDALACYMLPADVLFLALPVVPGVADNVLRHADDVGDVAEDLGQAAVRGVDTPWGRRVYQRSDIDWDFIRPEGTRMAGMSNLEAAELGYAPVRLNPQTGKLDTLVLHHMNKEPGGALIEVWSSTHNARHSADRLAGRVKRPRYDPLRDPLLGWRKENPLWDDWFKVEQSVYWRWYKGGYAPPLGAVSMPPRIDPRLP